MGIMLVYDITNEKTFDDIVKWLRNIDEVRFIPGKDIYDKWLLYRSSDYSASSYFQ